MFLSKDDYTVYRAATGEEIENVVDIDVDCFPVSNRELSIYIGVWFLDNSGRLTCEKGESDLFRFAKKEENEDGQ